MKLYVFISFYDSKNKYLNLGNTANYSGWIDSTSFEFSQITPTELIVPWYYL